jgi:hypothetical protein
MVSGLLGRERVSRWVEVGALGVDGREEESDWEGKEENEE